MIYFYMKIQLKNKNDDRKKLLTSIFFAGLSLPIALLGMIYTSH